MKFLASVLIAAAAVGASAHHDGPHLFGESGDPTASSSSEGGHHRRGKWMCNMVAFQNKDITVDQCMGALEQIRESCESRVDTDEDRRRAVMTCVREDMHTKFDYVSLREMSPEMRGAFITEECSYTNEDGSPMHGDVAQCEATFNNIVDQCMEEAAEGPAFHRCLRVKFRMIHHGDGGDEGHTGGGRPHHGRPDETWRRGRAENGGDGGEDVRGGRHGGRRHGGGGRRGGRHGRRHHGGQNPEEPMPIIDPVDNVDGGVHIFPGEEKPVELPPMEKPYFGDDVSILPGEEGPEEGGNVNAEKPRHGGRRRRHGGGRNTDDNKVGGGHRGGRGRRDHATGRKVETLSERDADRSRFRGAAGRGRGARRDGRGRGQNFERRYPRGAN